MKDLRYLAAGFLAGALTVAAHAGASRALSAEPAASDVHRAFLAENHMIMERMMAAMDIAPSQDVDRDFAAMMIPHHQAAIDMAVLELRYGRNEQLRRIAQEIIVDQQQEIVAMHRALGQPPASPVVAGGHSHAEERMP